MAVTISGHLKHPRELVVDAARLNLQGRRPGSFDWGKCNESNKSYRPGTQLEATFLVKRVSAISATVGAAASEDQDP